MKTQRTAKLLSTDQHPKAWVANRNFDMKNLSVKKGQILPMCWQSNQHRKYLRDNFGEDCIILTDMSQQSIPVGADAAIITELQNEVASLKSEIEKLKANKLSSVMSVKPRKKYARKITAKKAKQDVDVANE